MLAFLFLVFKFFLILPCKQQVLPGTCQYYKAEVSTEMFKFVINYVLLLLTSWIRHPGNAFKWEKWNSHW